MEGGVAAMGLLFKTFGSISIADKNYILATS